MLDDVTQAQVGFFGNGSSTLDHDFFPTFANAAEGSM
jgi:hypothetical protein